MSRDFKKGINMPVPINIMQKLLVSTIFLTSFYIVLIAALHYDLTRKINKSLWQLLPGIGILVGGMLMNYILVDPSYVFKNLIQIKSAFARGAIGPMLLLITASIETMSIIACLTTLIDKMWYFWRNERLMYMARLLATVSISIIAGNTLFKMIFGNQKEVAKGTLRLNNLSGAAGTILSIVLLLITIMAIPHLFDKRKTR